MDDILFSLIHALVVYIANFFGIDLIIIYFIIAILAILLFLKFHRP